MTVLDSLTDIFREVFDDEEIRISPETTADDIDAWDSLSHANLIVTVEERFGIKFVMRELLSFRNVGDLLKTIEGRAERLSGVSAHHNSSEFVINR